MVTNQSERMSMTGSKENKARYLYIRFIEPDTYHVEDVRKLSSPVVDAGCVYQTDAGIN